MDSVDSGQRLPAAERPGSEPMSTPIITLDARGLPPPEPMIRVLEALTTLPIGSDLQVRTDRRPMHLYPLLYQRGFHGETTPAPDDGFITLIQRLPHPSKYRDPERITPNAN